MSRPEQVRSWWRGMPDADRFRAYTRITLQISAVAAVVGLALAIPRPVPIATVVVVGLVVTVLLEVQPGMSRHGRFRPLIPVGIVLLALGWAGSAIVVRTGDGQAARDAVLLCLVCGWAAALTVLPFVRYRWWWMLAIAVATAVVCGTDWASRAQVFAIVLGTGGIMVLTMVLTVRCVRLVDDLDRARGLEARLRVADERLRFARDLHDVVGRAFSAVAVKSELSATLARSGAVEKAATEMDEVKALAVDSMDQLRSLVRGYRGIDLAQEVAGARSLLSAIGCELVVEGDPARLPERLHEMAAWVTREGTTNIVRHSAATRAVLAFGTSAITLRNNGVHGRPNPLSGLRGLAERAHTVGAELSTDCTDDEFLLEIRWETA
ncbi:histidine kinase [Nakamurella sp. YIM 132087]|uniref:Histidine kinase n=1 Tax=Nakamurella alba TaxID=2665158 RepID=A0A7K1FQS6_9ACTN|nr:histidine kinase [Nakamurella alba]MTD16501.1 histidine kinase [Nakamurella alba]